MVALHRPLTSWWNVLDSFRWGGEACSDGCDGRVGLHNRKWETSPAGTFELVPPKIVARKPLAFFRSTKAPHSPPPAPHARFFAVVPTAPDRSRGRTPVGCTVCPLAVGLVLSLPQAGDPTSTLATAQPPRR